MECAPSCVRFSFDERARTMRSSGFNRNGEQAGPKMVLERWLGRVFDTQCTGGTISIRPMSSTAKTLPRQVPPFRLGKLGQPHEQKRPCNRERLTVRSDTFSILSNV